MKRKMILLAISLVSFSSIGMADSVQDILKKAREDYYKEQKEMEAPKVKKEKPAKVKEETSVSEEAEEPQAVYEEEVAEEEVKPKTPLEKLEYNAEKAMIKVDFYERVVRSVAREEKELGSYDEILGKKKVKKENKKETVK